MKQEIEYSGVVIHIGCLWRNWDEEVSILADLKAIFCQSSDIFKNPND